MTTKLALCLVSKVITEEYLYEIVTIYHYQYIEKLARLLNINRGTDVLCGLHVRRLHILLG